MGLAAALLDGTHGAAFAEACDFMHGGVQQNESQQFVQLEAVDMPILIPVPGMPFPLLTSERE